MSTDVRAEGFEVAFPFTVDAHGQVGSVDYPHHVEQMIIQLLLTAPGERVNRPGFGCGLLARVFALDDSATAASVQFEVMGALQRWLADVVEARSVHVQPIGTRLRIDITYVILRDQKTYRTRLES